MASLPVAAGSNNNVVAGRTTLYGGLLAIVLVATAACTAVRDAGEGSDGYQRVVAQVKGIT